MFLQSLLLGKSNMEILRWLLFFSTVWTRWLELLEPATGILWLNGGRWWGSLADNPCISRYLLPATDRSSGSRLSDFFSTAVFGLSPSIDTSGVSLSERSECWLFERCTFVSKLLGRPSPILGLLGNKRRLIPVQQFTESDMLRWHVSSLRKMATSAHAGSKQQISPVKYMEACSGKSHWQNEWRFMWTLV